MFFQYRFFQQNGQNWKSYLIVDFNGVVVGACGSETLQLLPEGYGYAVRVSMELTPLCCTYPQANAKPIHRLLIPMTDLSFSITWCSWNHLNKARDGVLQPGFGIPSKTDGAFRIQGLVGLSVKTEVQTLPSTLFLYLLLLTQRCVCTWVFFVQTGKYFA